MIQTNCGIVKPNMKLAASHISWHHPLPGSASSYWSLRTATDSSIVQVTLGSASYPGQLTSGPEKPKMMTMAMRRRPISRIM